MYSLFYLKRRLNKVKLLDCFNLFSIFIIIERIFLLWDNIFDDHIDWYLYDIFVSILINRVIFL